MGKLLKSFKSTNALLVIFIGASLVVFTVIASNSSHRPSDGSVSQNASIQTQRQQSAPAAENQAVLQPAAKGKTTAQSQTAERANISSSGNSAHTKTEASIPAPVTATAAPVLINNNAGANSTSAATAHFSVSGRGGNDGGGDERGDDGGGDN